MNSPATDLWNAWRESDEIRGEAEEWITASAEGRERQQERLYAAMADDPDRAFEVFLAIAQLTDDPKDHANLAAGLLEDFLGRHGERYVDRLHELALAHRRLREVLDGVWQGAMPKTVWRRIELLKQSAFS